MGHLQLVLDQASILKLLSFEVANEILQDLRRPSDLDHDEEGYLPMLFEGLVVILAGDYLEIPPVLP